MGKTKSISHLIEIIPHLQIRVVNHVIGAIRLPVAHSGDAGSGKIFSMNMIGKHIIGSLQRWQAFFEALQGQAVGGVDAGRAHDGNASARHPAAEAAQLPLGVNAARGARLRMLASWENGGDDASKDVLSVRVTEVPADSRLGTTVGGGNLIVVSGDLIGDLTLAGAGAGPGSTASGVISDILAIAGGEGSSWGELPPADNAPAPAWFLAAKKKRGDA